MHTLLAFSMVLLSSYKNTVRKFIERSKAKPKCKSKSPDNRVAGKVGKKHPSCIITCMWEWKCVLFTSRAFSEYSICVCHQTRAPHKENHFCVKHFMEKIIYLRSFVASNKSLLRGFTWYKYFVAYESRYFIPVWRKSIVNFLPCERSKRGYILRQRGKWICFVCICSCLQSSLYPYSVLRKGEHAKLVYGIIHYIEAEEWNSHQIWIIHCLSFEYSKIMSVPN